MCNEGRPGRAKTELGRGEWGMGGEAELDKADLWHISLRGHFQYLDN